MHKSLQHTSILILVGLVLSAYAHAQPAPFLPGHVVTLQGDTLRGALHDATDLERTLGIRFRDEHGTEWAYTPTTVAGYGFDDGRHFVSRVLLPGPNSEPETLFLQVLVTGMVNLYRFAHQPPEETRSPSTLATVRENRYAVEYRGQVQALYEAWRPEAFPLPERYVVDRQYRRGLAIAFAGCPQMQERTTRLRYTQTALIAAVASYHECIDEEYAVATSGGLARRGTTPITTSFRIGGGVKQVAYRRNSDIGPGWGRTATAEFLMNVSIPTLAQNMSIPMGLVASYTSIGSDFLTDHPTPTFFFQASDFDRFRVGVTLGARYYFSRGETPTYISAGLSITQILGEPGSFRRWPTTTELPTKEAGWYAEAATRLNALSRFGGVNVGLRYELSGLGGIYPHQAPFRTDWRISALTAIVGMDF